MNRFIPILCLALLASGASSQQDWPDYRGPNADGKSAVIGLPLKWDEKTNIKWKTPIHDRGWSSPVVWGNQVWMTSASEDGHKMYALCLDRETGKVLSDRKIFENATPDSIHELNSYASPTPVIEAGRVYVHFGNYGTACLDTKTYKTLWERRNLPCKFSVGPGSSPLISDDLLILTMDGIDLQYVVALNKMTGKTVWKTERATDWSVLDGQGKGENEMKKAFVTPILAFVEGKPQLISPAAQAVYAYNPKTGKELWRVRFKGFSQSSRPILGDGMVYVNTGYGRPNLLAIQFDGTGDVTDSHVAWKCVRNVPSKPSPLLIKDTIFMLDDGGVASCLDAKTGVEIWKDRVASGDYSSSPLLADGRIYCFSQQGSVTVLKPGRKFEVLAQFKMTDGTMASPAIAGKAMFVRTKSALYRVENP
ncbi:MAG: PQQ-binding-like beta-propeller repeat protein [Chthonomonadaceae bacterium]|nr:PQQ-binding-like beta-propeller repeat protein [Chthonomonadaceae bacterium]